MSEPQPTITGPWAAADNTQHRLECALTDYRAEARCSLSQRTMALT